MKGHHEFIYIKNMCENLSDMSEKLSDMSKNLSESFNEKALKNEISAFSNFLCSSTDGYKYNRSYLEEQFKKYIHFRQQVRNHIDRFHLIKKILLQEKLLQTFPKNTKIEFIINNIFRIDLSNYHKRLEKELKWEESDFFSEVKTSYFNNSLSNNSILIMLNLNNKKIYRYFEFDTSEEDKIKTKINKIIKECKKIIKDCGELENEE